MADRETIARSDDHRALRIWLRLLTCTQMIERVVRSRLREQFGTTLPRFDLLAQLERHPEGLKMNELSRLLMVTGGNVTGLTDELARDGLVAREASPGDRRAWIVRLTPKGKSTFAAMAEEHERWIRELFAGFDSAAVAGLHAQLGTLRVHLLEKLKPSEAETS
jgi:DNA-binding MarR family transcriptional regulator